MRRYRTPPHRNNGWRSVPRAIAGPRSRGRSTNGTSGHLPLPQADADRRALVSRYGHARTLGAGIEHRSRGARGERSRGHARARGRVYAHSRRLVRDPNVQSWAQGEARGRNRHHAFAQPAPRRRVQVQPSQRWAGRIRRNDLDRDESQRVSQERSRRPEESSVREGSPRSHDASARLSRRVHY